MTTPAPRDVVVTVPRDLWTGWLDEGDLPGDPYTGEEWGFLLGGYPPKSVEPGISRVYVVAHGRLRGYAQLTGVWAAAGGRKPAFAFCRRGGAVAVTIDEQIKGFRGWRYRWWEREDERPFPEWRVP